MVNRVIQQKIVKMRRRKRYAMFSGGDAKVELGQISLSKQVINVGLRVPGKVPAKHSLNRERMQQINPRKDMVAEIRTQLQFPFTQDMAREISNRLEKHNQDLAFKTCLFNGRKVKVWLFFNPDLKNVYLLKIDLRLETIQQSCFFSTIEQAQDAFRYDRVPWMKFTVETISG